MVLSDSFMLFTTDVMKVYVDFALYRILEVNEKLEVIRMRVWQRHVSNNPGFI